MSRRVCAREVRSGHHVPRFAFRSASFIPGIESASAARPLGEDTDTAHLHDEEKGGDDWFPLSALALTS
jgi:hypothetical protein